MPKSFYLKSALNRSLFSTQVNVFLKTRRMFSFYSLKKATLDKCFTSSQ